MGNFCKFQEAEELEIISKAKKDYSKDEFQEIKDFRKEIKKMNIFKRKETAKKEFKKFIENTNYDINIKITNEKEIKNKYIEIVCLLLIDNTNKNIVKLYLNFIKKYSDFIKNNKLIPYEKEIEKYKIIFTIDETEQLEKNIKTKSQRDIFLDYINYFSSTKLENNELQFLKQTKKKLDKLYLFNTPIEFENEELYYYKCLYNLLFDISSKINDDIFDIKVYLKNKQNVIKYIIRKKLYDNPQIILNEDKMNLLNLYMLREIIEENYKENDLTNFNRLIQKKPVTIKDFNLFNKGSQRNLLINIDKIYYIAHKYNPVKEVSINIPLSKACLNNLNNSKFKDQPIAKYYYHLESLFLENEIKLYINDIKNFLIKIMDSNTFKQAIKELFPEYFNYLNINNNEEIKQFIKERIKYYPFEGLDISGTTDKLSCYSFITSINFEMGFDTKEIKITDIDSDAYKVSLSIVNSLNEIIHAEQAIIFFKENNKYLEFASKRIAGKDKKGKDIGMNFENLLFGKVINKIDFFQCLYIMNEKNYEQNLAKFRDNFRNIKKIVKDSKGEIEFLHTKDGIFKKFFKYSNEEIKNILRKIQKKSNNNFPKIYIGKDIICIEDEDNDDKDEDDEDYLPRRKCGLIGGSKKIFEISKK